MFRQLSDRLAAPFLGPRVQRIHPVLRRGVGGEIREHQEGLAFARAAGRTTGLASSGRVGEK